MSFIYHFVPPEMVGDTLMPLNVLRVCHPTVYENAVKKYQGREFLMHERIHSLNCLWNDVLHFSTIDPRLILNKLNMLGLVQSDDWSIYEVPSSVLVNQKVTVFTPFYPELGAFKLRPEDFSEFSGETYREMQQLNSSSITYFNEVKKEGGRALLFKHIPHVLMLGQLNVKGLSILKWKKPIFNRS